MANKNLESRLGDVKVVVTDIMGTTTPNSCIAERQSDFAKYGAEYMLRNAGDPVVRNVIEQVSREIKPKGSQKDVAQAVVDYVRAKIEKREFKPEYLKLSGAVNTEGFKQGRLKGEVYGDVADSLKNWKKNGKGIYVYSNGSEESQKWMFKTSNQGDLTQYIDGYFDTAVVGDKLQAASYRRIADSVKAKPGEMAFLSDLIVELDAAKGAGYRLPVLVNREGNKPQPKNNYKAVSSFREV